MCLGHGQLARDKGGRDRDKGGRDRDKGGRDRVERAIAKAHEPHGRNRSPQPSRRRGAGCVGIQLRAAAGKLAAMATRGHAAPQGACSGVALGRWRVSPTAMAASSQCQP